MVLVEHHIKYKEIHGYDETVFIEKGEHYLLHKRLRLEGKCTIPPKTLRRISETANKRTKKYKLWSKRYRTVTQSKYYATGRKYSQINRRVVSINETIGLHVRLRENIIYNISTGSVSVLFIFEATNGYKLYNIDENVREVPARL